MKKILIILLLIPVFVLSQTTEEFDFVSPLNDGVSAVQKGNSWGFINDKGDIFIAFRDDLFVTENEGHKYPIFKNNRCLISEIKEGITYFGFIDKTGETIIEPKFLNALNFDNDETIALELIKDVIGENDVLKKNIVNYKYCEVILTSDGTIKHYLNPKGVRIVLDKKFLKAPPEITSKFISNSLVAVKNENKKWIIKLIE
ncbi:WG repeat-containing protein [Algibacter sp.]|uniref:WG repeat-containing protein n=1 Tax=Algibacter sp. TaxID=1872428 RepID=UPI003C71FADE